MKYNPGDYESKRRSAEEAIAMIRSGQRIFIGSSCGEPQHLVSTLLNQSTRFSDLEILRLLSLEGMITSMYGDRTYGRDFTIRSIYQGSGTTEHFAGSQRFLTPMNISLIPRFFKSRQLPIHFALIQVSPPDEFGWMALGVSVDITLAAAQAADVVIAQVNPRMPRVNGSGFIHVSEVDSIVEAEEELLTVLDFPEPEVSDQIARLVANLIEDGSTIQLGIGEGATSILRALMEKNDLGVHTQYLTDGIMALMSEGIVTNRRKGWNTGKTVASAAIGSHELYRYLHNHPMVELHPSDMVNNPGIISRHDRMVSINFGTAIDLTGHVAADALPQNHFTGVTGMADFVEGSLYSEGGKSIIVLPSTTSADSQGGRRSRIVPELEGGSVVVPRTDVSHIVTEFGAVNLFGKSLQERAMAVISISHPDFRDELLQKAKEMGLIARERSLHESLYGVYPARIEEERRIGTTRVTFRPVKISDIRGIQEHFYTMDRKDIVTRFFQQRSTFFQDQMESAYLQHIDYIKNMTIVAVEGDPDFGRIIGLGEYVIEHNMESAEVAFSVVKEWQGKGVAGVIIRKLAEAARENGIGSLVAYILPKNRAMIATFKKLADDVSTRLDDDHLVMVCKLTG